MNEIIQKRQSIRTYEHTPLDDATLEALRTEIKNVTPLYPNIRYSIEITDKPTKGLYNVKAPYYLIFGSEKKDGAHENIGFIGQQLDLFLSEIGIGTCWLGIAKPGKAEEKEDSILPFVICMSFGRPAEPLYRNLASKPDRKALEEISEGVDERLEAARLAPNSHNAQNWYFIAQNREIHCYRKKTNPFVRFVYNRLNAIDVGIAICHIAEESSNFSFLKKPDAPMRTGYVYIGTVI
ncbi:MAG: nitroreductase [Oscillospiraceae bacterium]|nr:nitroreductase [Oscillospiraceae bacterium]